MFTGTKISTRLEYTKLKDAARLNFDAAGESEPYREKRRERTFRHFECGRLCYNRRIFAAYAAQTLNLRRDKI